MKAIAAAIVILFIGALTYFLLPKGDKQDSIEETKLSITVTPTPQYIEPFISETPDVSDLEMGGSSHLDEKGVYSFLYPNDFKLDTQGNGQFTRITKIGATQRGQTEIYDGIVIHFETINLNGQTLENYVDDRIQTETMDGTSEVVKAKKAVKLKDYPGFTYDLRGLGTSTYLIIQKHSESSSAVAITYLVADPENQNYQNLVDKTLYTLELLQ